MVKAVVIGGSAGSMQVVTALLQSMPEHFSFPIIVVLHRPKNVISDMRKIISGSNEKIIIREPEDKEPILPNTVYLAPQNYHLLVEDDITFSLDYSEAVNYSRPSIDVTFESVALVYGSKAVGILLSGANMDGAAGLDKIIKHGGTGIVQDPETAEYPFMPKAAIGKNAQVVVRKPEFIVSYITAIDLIH